MADKMIDKGEVTEVEDKLPETRSELVSLIVDIVSEISYSQQPVEPIFFQTVQIANTVTGILDILSRTSGDTSKCHELIHLILDKMIKELTPEPKEVTEEETT